MRKQIQYITCFRKFQITQKNKIGGIIMAEKAVQVEQPIKKENKMGTMPVNKLLLSMALPMYK